MGGEILSVWYNVKSAMQENYLEFISEGLDWCECIL